MKWRGTEPVEGKLDTELPDKMIEWAHQHEKIVRGHALLWAKRHSCTKFLGCWAMQP